jgi:hypothetical protein
LESFEDIININPMVGLLVPRTTRKWVADVEGIAVELLVGMGRKVLGQEMGGR